MYVPLISHLNTRPSPPRSRLRRKGGGGGSRNGGGGSGGGRSGGGSGSSSSSGSGGGSRGSSSGGSGSSSGSRSPVPLSRSSNTYTGGRNSATPYGVGGGQITTIPAGQLFAGRSVGGGTRDQVFGTRSYGSGYPGTNNQRGVAGLGFPFYFWPIVWGLTIVDFADIDYLHESEYGDPSNSSRPGSILTTATFASNSQNSTFRIIADNSTTYSLATSLSGNCTSYLAINASSNFTPQPFDPAALISPKPEQAVQYYRASSVVLTLDGYNDTATLRNTAGLPDTPLPNGVDMSLLACLNQTIGAAVPLISGVRQLHAPVHSGLVIGLFWLLWAMKHNIT